MTENKSSEKEKLSENSTRKVSLRDKEKDKDCSIVTNSFKNDIKENARFTFVEDRIMSEDSSHINHTNSNQK